MTSKLAQAPKKLAKNIQGETITYLPVKTGSGGKAVPADLMMLRAEQQHFTVAFTQFCPLHATNVHAAAQCKQWQTKLAKQRGAKVHTQQGRSGRTDWRADRNDQAQVSRDKERQTF